MLPWLLTMWPQPLFFFCKIYTLLSKTCTASDIVFRQVLFITAALLSNMPTGAFVFHKHMFFIYKWSLFGLWNTNSCRNCLLVDILFILYYRSVINLLYQVLGFWYWYLLYNSSKARSRSQRRSTRTTKKAQTYSAGIKWYIEWLIT